MGKARCFHCGEVEEARASGLNATGYGFQLGYHEKTPPPKRRSVSKFTAFLLDTKSSRINLLVFFLFLFFQNLTKEIMYMYVPALKAL